MTALRNFEPDVRFLAKMYKNPAPCDACPNMERCQDEQTACLDFMHFVDSGQIHETTARKNPTASLFKMTMES